MLDALVTAAAPRTLSWRPGGRAVIGCLGFRLHRPLVRHCLGGAAAARLATIATGRLAWLDGSREWQTGGGTASMTTQTRMPFHHPRVRPEWLARLREDVLEPDLPIIDPHHHLWHARPDRYLLEDLAADVSSGHNVVATVFIQCGAFYRQDGPAEMRPVGETEFVASVAAECERGGHGGLRACAVIIGHADCLLGERIDPVLEAHIQA